MDTKRILEINAAARYYLQDNLMFLQEANQAPLTGADVASYYQEGRENAMQVNPEDESYLSLNEEEKAHFARVADAILRDGYYPHS